MHYEATLSPEGGGKMEKWRQKDGNRPFNMRPDFLKFGGFENFVDYQQWFADEYLDEPLYEVRGKRVIFAHPKFNGEHDCAHAIWGTPSSKWYKKESWDKNVQRRAERLPWIKAALTNPNVTIHLSTDGVYPKSESHVYLWVAKSEDNVTPDEFYMVVTIDGKIVGEPNAVLFYTAYTIELPDFRAKKQKYRRIWPEPVTSKRGRSK